MQKKGAKEKKRGGKLRRRKKGKRKDVDCEETATANAKAKQEMEEELAAAREREKEMERERERDLERRDRLERHMIRRREAASILRQQGMWAGIARQMRGREVNKNADAEVTGGERKAVVQDDNDVKDNDVDDEVQNDAGVDENSSGMSRVPVGGGKQKITIAEGENGVISVVVGEGGKEAGAGEDKADRLRRIREELRRKRNEKSADK